VRPRRRRGPDGRGFDRPALGYAVPVIEVRHGTAGPSAASVVLVNLRRASSRELARLLRTAMRAGDLSILVDLGDQTDASSDLLSLLHRSSGGLRELRGRLGIVCGQADLRRLLDVTLLSQAFAVFPSRDEALRSWG
jgi:anti-anti-sigma regulatory factor